MKNTGQKMAAAVFALIASIAQESAGLAQECDKPNMLIVLDRSGSMDDGVKWPAAVSAIQNILSQYGSQLRWGLMLFASNDNCGYGIINVHVGDNTAASINSTIAGTTPTSCTPIAGSLINANNAADLHDSSRLNFLMLITDGAPNCPTEASACGGADTARSINASASLFASGIHLYAIGMTGADFGTLNNMAAAGGTVSAYDATNSANLQPIMQQIVQKATTRPCQNACGTGYETCDLVNKKWVNCNAPTNCCTDTNVPCDTNKLGICAIGAMKCVNGSLTCVQTNQPQQEVCDGLDNDCNGTADDGIAPQACTNSCGNSGNKYCVNGHWSACDAAPCCTDTNAPCNTGKPGICADGKMKCVGDVLTCVQTNQPQPVETCNGLDDNCDGQVDEGDPGGGAPCVTGLPGECATGHMHCRGGRLVCVPDKQPTAEICDGLDNDCDGVVDNGNPGGGASCDTGLKGECAYGVTVCENGALVCHQLNQPTQEKCDGLDNDCDGVVDNGDPGGGKVCPTGQKGECAAGHTACEGGQIVCKQDKQPATEVCDGVDNDCDGVVDNGDPGGGAPCDTGKFGECAAGTIHCKGGKLICVQNKQPEPEKCDGLDNDCDGLVDNGNPGGGKLCATGQPGECAVGHTKCEGGQIVCIPDKQPEPEKCDGLDNDCDGVIDNGVTNACGYCGPAPKEVCNGKDDDCNGKVDDNAECPPGKFCVNGDCVGACVNNECPSGLTCKGGYCVPPCNGVTCKPDEDCDNGVCANLCKDVKCKAGETCRHGQCLVDNCYEIGCLAGKICRNGTCVDDPCSGVTCDAAHGEFCRGGTCVASCATISCPFGQTCVDGACADDPCFQVSCDPGQVCDNGTCRGDPCASTTCGKGRVCVNGVCQDDPCLGVTCPRPGDVCVMGQCVSSTSIPDAGTVDGGGSGDAGPEAGRPDGATDAGTDGDAGQMVGDGPVDVRHHGPDGAGDGGEDGSSGIVHAGSGGGDDGAGEPGGCSCAVLGF